MIVLGPDGQPTDRDRARWAQTPTGLLVPGHVVHKPIGVDLFAGCGGFSLGMHQAGFHVAAAVELDFSAVLTYAVNLARPGVEFHFDSDERADEFDAFLARYMGLDAPKTKPRKKKGTRKTARVVEAPAMAGDGWIKDQPPSEEGCKHIWVGDVRTLTGAEILDALGVDEVDVVFGGPPCQGFSFAGKRNVMDPRNSLIFEFARLVLELRARTMAMTEAVKWYALVVAARRRS